MARASPSPHKTGAFVPLLAASLLSVALCACSRSVPEKAERIVHVGIYLADRQFIHCSGRVRVSSLDPNSPDHDEWHAKGFLHARRPAIQ